MNINLPLCASNNNNVAFTHTQTLTYTNSYLQVKDNSSEDNEDRRICT